MPAARSRVRSSLRRPSRKRRSSTKRTSRKRRTNTRRRIPRSIRTTDFFVNKYLVCTGQATGAGGPTLNCSINGSSPTTSGVVQQNGNVNIYTFWFTLGDIQNAASGRLFAEWQEIRFLKAVFSMVPRITGNTTPSFGFLCNQYMWTAYNKTGFIPTNLLQVEQMSGSKKYYMTNGTAKKHTRTIFPYIQAPMNDFLSNSGVDKPIRSPWFNTFVGTTTNQANVNAIAQTGIVVGVPSIASSTYSQLYDIECEYWVACRKRTGNI